MKPLKKSIIKEKKPIGRPSDYTQELADEFCKRLATGKSLRTVCLADDMPSGQTIFNWFRTHKEFLEQYALAKQAAADAQYEILEDLSDEAIEESKSREHDPKAINAIVSAYKLKADNLKWAMSKMKPKKYGEKLDVTSDGKALPTPILGGISTEIHEDKGTDKSL